ncbi:14512_t:CDS:2 [Ambispora leptoticha]|uniref:14512_t:CDS:1 n=1 Tax=Ambispora leptoticha TaxID=144679 RepID=A0A9N9GFE0_9GLOM|nr:14512_t:CDS:2 [Ambispora leptoticha]
MVSKKFFLITFVLATTSYAIPFHSKSNVKQLAPILTSLEADVIADQYLVVFKNTAKDSHINYHHECINNAIDFEKDMFVKRSGGYMQELVSGIRYTYNFKNLKGYAGRFSEEVLRKIRESDEVIVIPFLGNGDLSWHISFGVNQYYVALLSRVSYKSRELNTVAYVERDQTVYASELQKNAPWGLSRISHRAHLTFGTFNKYPYHETAGTDVTVYIIDTGVNINHTDFENRAVWGATIPDGDEDVDGNGHGTHVAGTVAGKRYGVSKKAKIVAVKVLRSNGSGTMSDVIKGVEWAAEAHLEDVEKAKKEGKTHKGSAANMSLGGGRSRTLDAAVNGAVDAGIHFAVAAGNDNRDACDYSPAAAEKAVTVGASTIEDERAWFSNYGSCVDVFAPGKDITSAWIGSKFATNTISGTSMASPHVAGLLAYFLSLQADSTSDFYVDPLSPKELKDKVILLSTKDALDKIPSNTPNKLVYNDYQ